MRQLYVLVAHSLLPRVCCDYGAECRAGQPGELSGLPVFDPALVRQTPGAGLCDYFVGPCGRHRRVLVSDFAKHRIERLAGGVSRGWGDCSGDWPGQSAGICS
ncbi:hypothetical protein D3C87_1791610 [compost metagenome]